jgi:hypothetical protein
MSLRTHDLCLATSHLRRLAFHEDPGLDLDIGLADLLL